MAYLGAIYGIGAIVNLVSDVFRNLFYFIDVIVYSLIPLVYSLIYSLYDITSILDEQTLTALLKNITETVYSFLAIFMFFRVAFSLITMLVDPSVIDDKDKGAKKIVTNIMICLILIVAVPVVFDYAKKLQTKILDERIIEKIVIGNVDDEDEISNLGNELSLAVLSTFLYPVDDATTPAKERWDAVFKDKTEGLLSLQFHLGDLTGGGITSLIPIVGIFSESSHYSLSYVFILSTIVGVYVLWTFIQMMVDVAYRSIKFLVLELLAPIAIVSYIDPMSSKKGVFSKWLSETVKTYISLFIRIFVFSFVSVLLKSLDMSILDRNGLFEYIFFILAIIAFIKTAPKFIDNLFGTTISKESESNLASGLKSVLGFAGMTAGAVAGGISNAVVAKAAGKSTPKAAWAGIKGAWAAGSKGMAAGKKGGLGGMVGVVTNAYGTYGDAKKAYGLNIDPEMEKLTNQWEKRVPEVDAAKKKAIADLEENDNAKYKQILQTGTSVNGRKYGRGLENDEGLVNLIKKNDAGLAADEIKHEGDSEFLMLRNLVHDAKQSDAIVQRTLANAKSDYEFANDAYNSATNKGAYTIDFEMGTAKMNYDSMNENSLQESFNQELQKMIDKRVNGISKNFNTFNRDERIEILLSASNGSLDINTISNMSDSTISSEYERLIRTNIEEDVSGSGISESFKNAKTQDAKVKLALQLKQSNIEYDVSTISDSELDDRFDKANKERIISVYGNSLANIESDAAKSSGDAKAADDALKSYVNGRGKKAKDIDAAYALADSRHKARKLEEKRNKDNNS